MARAALAQPYFEAPWRSFDMGRAETAGGAVALVSADLDGDGRPQTGAAKGRSDIPTTRSRFARAAPALSTAWRTPPPCWAWRG